MLQTFLHTEKDDILLVMKEIFVPQRNEERGCKDADFCKKLIQKQRDNFFLNP